MQLERAGAQPLRADALPQPAVSVVIPVFNEAASIPRLHTRLHRVLQQLGRSFEVVSRVASVAVAVPMTVCGSMLRAYRRPVVDEILRLAERALFIPALGAWLARRPTEISIRHEARVAGRSRYSPLRFMQLGFDLMTGFSLVPIQLVSLAGIGVALLGIAFGAFLLVRRLVLGPESEGLFTLFAILFVFVGILIFAVGLVGEYVGRIYAEVRRRPSYVVRAVYPADPEEPCASS